MNATQNTVPSCALDREGLRRQRDRHARLAPSVRGLEREEQTLAVTFDSGLDRDALAQMIAVERECCPFFELEFDERRRRLTVSVCDASHAPALDAIAAALTLR